jgi:hypothetical protein
MLRQLFFVNSAHFVGVNGIVVWITSTGSDGSGMNNELFREAGTQANPITTMTADEIMSSYIPKMLSFVYKIVRVDYRDSCIYTPYIIYFDRYSQ